MKYVILLVAYLLFLTLLSGLWSRYNYHLKSNIIIYPDDLFNEIELKTEVAEVIDIMSRRKL